MQLKKSVLKGLDYSRAGEIAELSCHFNSFSTEILINLNAKASHKAGQ
jgi:hypothetical protein